MPGVIQAPRIGAKRMDMFVVQGGTPLRGEVQVSGAKNAALPILAATLAVDGPCRLQQIPDLVDVKTLLRVLESLDSEVTVTDDGVTQIESSSKGNCVADYELVRRMRASFCVLGPLLARRGHACVSLPGGCNIGDRPINLHLKGLRALGAEIKVERGYVIAEARQLRGARIYLGGPFGSTVTGTCNVLVAAALAKGRTTIEAAACEPEVVDLGNFLNACGAQIRGLGTPFLEIDGVTELKGTHHTVIPDRIEAATLMLATAITRGNVTIRGAVPRHMTAVIETLRNAGALVECDDNGISVSTKTRPIACDCTALPYPGIPTDVQAQFMALLTHADGISVITDKVFPDRFMHAAELARMGAQIRREGPTAIIQGTPELSGAHVMASDLRASAALVLAGLAAKGTTVIRRIYHLDRGYERFEEKLNRLGAKIRREKDHPASATTFGEQETEQSVDAPHFLKFPATDNAREDL